MGQGDFNLSIGRDVRGNVNVHNTRDTYNATWDAAALAGALADFHHGLIAARDDGLQRTDDILKLVSTAAAELNRPADEVDRGRVRALMSSIREVAVGTMAGLLASTIDAQVPWIWS